MAIFKPVRTESAKKDSPALDAIRANMEYAERIIAALSHLGVKHNLRLWVMKCLLEAPQYNPKARYMRIEGGRTNSR